MRVKHLLCVSTRLVANMMVAVALLSLVFPPDLAAAARVKNTSPADLPDQFSVTFDAINHTLHFQRAVGGYTFVSADGQQNGFIDDSEIAKISTNPNPTNGANAFDISMTIIDGSGAVLPYDFKGTWNKTDDIKGTLTLPDGTADAITVNVPGLAGADSVTMKRRGEKAIIIIIPAAVVGVGVVACWLGSWWVDCAEECRAACAPNGVRSFTEGRCGSSCTCDCYPPPAATTTKPVQQSGTIRQQ